MYIFWWITKMEKEEGRRLYTNTQVTGKKI